MLRKPNSVKCGAVADSVNEPPELRVPANVTVPMTGTLETVALSVRLDVLRVNDAVSKWITPGMTSTLLTEAEIEAEPEPIWPEKRTLPTTGTLLAVPSKLRPELLRV